MVNKALNKLTFYELDMEILIEHAVSLGGSKGLEALSYLRELCKQGDVSAPQKELPGDNVTKQKEMPGDHINRLAYDNFSRIRIYCEKYWPGMPLPELKDGDISKINIESGRNGDMGKGGETGLPAEIDKGSFDKRTKEDDDIFARNSFDKMITAAEAKLRSAGIKK
jgi:hypothetical protein